MNTSAARRSSYNGSGPNRSVTNNAAYNGSAFNTSVRDAITPNTTSPDRAGHSKNAPLIRRLMMGAAWVLGMVPAGAALAQERHLDGDNIAVAIVSERAVIVVTAAKIARPANDLGMFISVVEGDVLSQSDGAEDLVQYVPGLQAAVANGAQVAFQIRGIGAVDHQALTPTAAAVYVDGVYQATNVQTSPLLFDLEQVEVLKGPQGSLYGRNASSGAIAFQSVLPGDETEGYLRAEAGNFSRVNVNGAVTIPIIDAASLRLSGRYLNQGPVLENIQSNTSIEAPKNGGGERDEFGLRAILRVSPDQGTEFVANLHYAQDKGINQAPRNSSLNLGKHEISIGPYGIQQNDTNFYGGSVKVSRDIGAFTLVSHNAFTGYRQRYGFDFDGTQAPFDNATLNANLAYDRDFSQFSSETRLQFEDAQKKLMIGFYRESEDFEQEYLIWCGDLDRTSLLGTCRYVGAPGRVGPDPASPGTATTLQSVIEQSRDTIALYTYNTLRILPKMEIAFGGRVFNEKIEGEGEGRHIFDDGTVALNNRDGLGLAEGSNRISDTRFTGNLGLNFDLNDNSLLYLSWSNGFKSGGFNGEVINNATHFSDEGLFEAEVVDAFEVGLKMYGSNYSLNMAGFYQFYDNPQARIFVPFDTGNGGSFTSNSLSNLDEARSYGFEWEGSWTPIRGLELRGGTTFLKSKISQQVDPDVPQNAESFDGNPLPYASEFSSVFSVQYRWNLNDNLDMALRANGKYQSAFYLDAEALEDRRQPGYGLLDASATLYFDNGTEVGIWGRNLSNSEYAVAGFGFIGYNRFLGAPRSYGLRAGYSF